jgi:Domain of unknown function (DUF4124)
MTDKATGQTTSHSTRLSKDDSQIAGYDMTTSHQTGETTSRPTKPSKNDRKVTGYRLKLFVAFVAGLVFSFPVAAKLYKWVDDNGTTHYGETIPPEYADKDRVELNKEGRVIKSEEVMTPERRRAKELEEEKQREDERAALEQNRRDKTLINTYSNVHEIDLARTRSVQQVDARINVLNSYLNSANEKLQSLQSEADNYAKANRKIPPSLQEDLNDTQERLIKLQQDLEKPNAQKAALEARFKADRARYIELTGGN